jgi:hypothetical protein
VRNEDKIRASDRIAAAGVAVDQVAVDQNVIDQIGKLLKLAAKNNSEAEATSAMNKAQALMARHSLSMAAIEQGTSSAKAARRSDEKLKGGLYQFQRDLWEAVASLNFCFYFHLYERDREKVSQYWVRRYGGKDKVPEWRKGGFVFRHRLVGRAVNVQATIAMCGYLENAIERLVRERLDERNAAKVTRAEAKEREHGMPAGYFNRKPDPLWGEWAVKFREGVCDTVVSKIGQRRRQMLSEEQFKRSQATEAGRAGAQTGTGLSLMDVTEQETAANYDFLHGEGAYARLLERRARAAAREAEREAEYAAWAAANPEAAKEQEEQRRKEERKRPWNYGLTYSLGGGKDKQDHGAYWDGRDAGEKVSLDQQVGGGAVARIGRR